MASSLVDPDVRGRGIGSRLIAHAEQGCIARGLAAAVLVNSSGYEVLGPKRSTRPLFERMGYRVLRETDASTVMGRIFGAAERLPCSPCRAGNARRPATTDGARRPSSRPASTPTTCWSSTASGSTI